MAPTPACALGRDAACGLHRAMPERPRRRGAARALVVLASLVAFLALPAIWLDRQLLNTDNWTEASSQLLDDPAIREQTAAYLTDQLFANVDVQAELAEALPPRPSSSPARPPACCASGPARSREELLTRPRVQQLWEDANRAAHELLLKVLEGGGDIVSTAGRRRRARPQGAAGRSWRRATGLGGRMQPRLPDDAAQITILRSDQLGTAQDAAKLLDGLPIVLVGLSLLLFGAALLVAPGYRRQAVRGYGIGLGARRLRRARRRGRSRGDALVNELATDGVAASRPCASVRDIYDRCCSRPPRRDLLRRRADRRRLAGRADQLGRLGAALRRAVPARDRDRLRRARRRADRRDRRGGRRPRRCATRSRRCCSPCCSPAASRVCGA